jgi:hypothetical protein
MEVKHWEEKGREVCRDRFLILMMSSEHWDLIMLKSVHPWTLQI